MQRDEVLDILRRHQSDLQSRGVRHVALFGSTARGDRHAGSDIDIVIELDADTGLGVYDYVDLKAFIAGLFEGAVDVVNREGLKPHVRAAALSNAIYAF
ncbi:nucleotidyltransferase family protein [Aquibium microcysteis]|uniref:nucleotidyltransferase family protein n=1 Tax=Aquibium microcysteis TaxID=675281 RepID=UPI00165D2CBA|nr:nucleotidyltransferase domain-containing protein [Aquibium microcysteis]